jgi:hypothetical protein
MKKRLLDETVEAFNQHPAFTEKVKVYHKFPYEERIQYGVLLRSTSASQIRMSADNYLANLYSHVRLAKDRTYPGLSIEWVRENSIRISQQIEEDLSGQTDPTQRRLYTTYQIVKGFGDTRYANNIGEVQITINDVPTLPEYVNGEKRIVMLKSAPASGDIIKISYYYRTLDQPGVYVVDFTEDNQFVVAPVYIINSQVLIENTTGTETTADFGHTLIYPASEDIYLQSQNGGVPVLLIRDTDYSVDYATGLITLLNPLQSNFELMADYRYQPGDSRGPFEFKPYQEVHDAIPGAVISIGRRAKKGDRQVIVLTKFREMQAQIYGGHWTMSLSLAVIAKDPVQMEEMTDHLVDYLWGQRKNVLEFEGITLNSVEPTGEMEEVYVDNTGDNYYESTVDINVQTEWQTFVPYLLNIRHIFVYPKQFWVDGEVKNYDVGLQNEMVFEPLTPDMNTVLHYGATSYERVL